MAQAMDTNMAILTDIIRDIPKAILMDIPKETLMDITLGIAQQGEGYRTGFLRTALITPFYY